MCLFTCLFIFVSTSALHFFSWLLPSLVLSNFLFVLCVGFVADHVATDSARKFNLLLLSLLLM